MFDNRPKHADDHVVVDSCNVPSATERDPFHAEQHTDDRKRGRSSADDPGAALRRSVVAAPGTRHCRDALQSSE
jgi:hypothetical protein